MKLVVARTKASGREKRMRCLTQGVDPGARARGRRETANVTPVAASTRTDEACTV